MGYERLVKMTPMVVQVMPIKMVVDKGSLKRGTANNAVSAGEIEPIVDDLTEPSCATAKE